MMTSAARLIRLLSADQNNRLIIAGRLTVHESLRAAGRLTANHADGMQFGHVFGNAHQMRHRPKRLAAKIKIKPSDDDADMAPISQRLRDLDKSLIKKLRFVNGNRGRVAVGLLQNVP